MKRMTQWAVALLVLLLTAAGALAEVDTTVLTAEPWVNSDGMTLIFSDGGKGQMINVQNMAFDTTWTASGDSITYTFSFYGEHSYTLTMAQENDVPTLTLNDTGAVYMRKADFEKLAEQKQSEGANFYDLKLGEEVDLGFVKLTFTGAHTSRKIGEETYRVADGGTQFFCLTGSIENTGKAEVSSNMIRCEVVINGEYTYSASTDFLFGGAVTNQIAPLTTDEIYITAQLADSVIDMIQTCEVHFSLNDQFKTQPMFVFDGDYAFSISLDEVAMQNATQEQPREMSYFKECPVLPDPTSYAMLRQAGYSSSSLNGKTTNINYRYAAEIYGDDPAPMFETYLSKLKEEGFTVEAASETYTVSDGRKKLAEITISSDSMSVKLEPGNENLTTRQSGANADAAAVQTEYYHLGDQVSAASANLTFEKKGQANELYSSIKKKSGVYSYVDDDLGNPLFYVFGTMKNTGRKSIDTRNVYAEFIFDDQYTYKADTAGVKEGSSSFINDLAPQSSTSYYIYAAVPQSVLDGSKKCVLHVGFTDGFDIKVRRGSDYDFHYCDDEFEILLSGGETDSNASVSTAASGETCVAVVQTKSSPLTMRKKAGEDSETICKIPKGETVTVLEKGSWALVEYDGHQGYVREKYLEYQEGEVAPETVGESVGNDGTYTATALGMGGDVTVTMTIQNGKIKDVKAVGEHETQGLGGEVIKELPGKIVKAQSADIDGISGATLTSNAILSAAKDCLEQAK